MLTGIETVIVAKSGSSKDSSGQEKVQQALLPDQMESNIDRYKNMYEAGVCVMHRETYSITTYLIKSCIGTLEIVDIILKDSYGGEIPYI